MTYEAIRLLISQQKQSHQFQVMDIVKYDHFAVMVSGEHTPCILLDNDIAELVKGRKWCVDGGGYPVINMDHEVVRLHDVVMAHTFAVKPENVFVDHINHDKLDNRRINLRFVSPTESSKNMPLKGNNTSGVTGVSKTKWGTYRAYITCNKKRIELGYYETLEEAANARREAEDRLGFKTRPATIKHLLCEMEENK